MSTAEEELIISGPEADAEIIAGAEIVPSEDALVVIAETLGLQRAQSGNFRATTATRESLAEMLAGPLSKNDLIALASFIDGVRALSPGSSIEMVAASASVMQWEARDPNSGAWRDFGGYTPSETQSIAMGPYQVKEAQLAVPFMQIMPVRMAAVMAQGLVRGTHDGAGMYTGRVNRVWFEPTEVGGGTIAYRMRVTTFSDDEIAGRPAAWAAEKARIEAAAAAEKARRKAAGEVQAEDLVKPHDTEAAAVVAAATSATA
jgi:hypothetical protein